MKPWKRTRKAYEWTLDTIPRSWKKKVTRIERRKIKEDAKKEIKNESNGRA